MIKNYQRFSAVGWPTQTAALDHVPHGFCGDADAGDADAGDVNSGDVNSGDVNSGDVNSGDVNSGDADSGDADSGDVNSGDVNSGDVNSGDVDSTIQTVVAIALQTSWLSLEAENRLRRLMAWPYGQEDFQAILALQRAVMEQRVIQESRQRLMLQTHLRSAESRSTAAFEPDRDQCYAIT